VALLNELKQSVAKVQGIHPFWACQKQQSLHELPLSMNAQSLDKTLKYLAINGDLLERLCSACVAQLLKFRC
jgi:hypothetical protein